MSILIDGVLLPPYRDIVISHIFQTFWRASVIFIVISCFEEFPFRMPCPIVSVSHCRVLAPLEALSIPRNESMAHAIDISQEDNKDSAVPMYQVQLSCL